MDEAERALLYSQSAGGGLYDSVVGDTVDTVVAVAKGFPGFLKSYWKTLKKVAQAPAKIAEVTAEAITTGSLNPFKREIDKIVTPIADTYEKAMEYKSMLTIIFNEPELYGMLHNFAERYWAATHPVERTRMAASAVSDVVVTVILAIFTVGAGAAANIAAKSGKLAKVARLLKKITSILKRVSPGSARLAKKLSKAEKAVDKAGDAGSAAKKAKKLAPDKKPKSSEVLDDGPKKEYGKYKDGNGPKTTTDANTAQNFTLKPNSKPDEDLITVYRWDRAGTKVIKSKAAQEKGYRASQEIIDNEDLDDLMMAHAIDSSKPPSPFISTTTDRRVAEFFAGKDGELILESEWLVPNYIKPSEFVKP